MVGANTSIKAKVFEVFLLIPRRPSHAESIFSGLLCKNFFVAERTGDLLLGEDTNGVIPVLLLAVPQVLP